MQSKGYLALVLHAHLPFVRHPEQERFLEEDWFFEAVLECYLPLWERLDRLIQEKVPFKLTLVMTPTLMTMLKDELLGRRLERHLDELIELAEREVHRTRKDTRVQPLARLYARKFKHAKKIYQERCQRDLVGAYARLQETGALEIITSAATHAYLPLLEPYPLAVAAQVRTAVESHQTLLGQPAKGFWAPECGSFPGLESWLGESRLGYFFADTHGILHAQPRPLMGVYAPLLCAPGLAVFGRDQQTSNQVWSASEGYPGHPEYRDFYRDIGFDLKRKQLGPQFFSAGKRKQTGIKYHRITGPTQKKEFYRPALARKVVQKHAAHFVAERSRQIERIAKLTKGLGPTVVVSLYDAELFGHWWAEGPSFIEAVLRLIAQDDQNFETITPSAYLERHPCQQQAQLSASSWGQGGFHQTWLNQDNEWIYRHLHWASGEMIRLAAKHPVASALLTRFLNQAARELMLAQSSDWAFIMKMKTVVPYAVRRTTEHLQAFQSLRDQIQNGQLDISVVSELENRHNLFPTLDYRCYRKDYQAPKRSPS